MDKSEIKELLKEWRKRVTYVRAEILADLRDAPKPNRRIEVEYADKNDSSKGFVCKTVGDMEGPFFDARDRQIENEERIHTIESALKKEGIDPFKEAFSAFLFVDTESSNCFNDVYKMCEYGHYMTDTSFKEMPKARKDILMNPGKDGKFFLTGRKGHRDLVLAHSEAEYKKSPRFYEFHNDISFYLKQPATMVLMWASENDIQALLDQCVRYQMAFPSFVSYDVQQLFMHVFPEFKGVPSLEKAAAFLEINIDGIVQHRPDEDAYITMLIFKEIVAKSKKPLMDLIYECPSCQCESIREYTSMKKRHKEHEAQRAEHQRNKARLARYNAELNELLSAPTPEGTPLEKMFAVSLEMKKHVDETLPLIKGWIDRGFYLRRSLGVSVLVVYDETERRRLFDILETKQSGLNIMLMEEFDALARAENE